MKNKTKKVVVKNNVFFKEVSQLSKQETIKRLDSSLLGLTKDQIEEKQKEYGKNDFSHKHFV